METVDSLHVAKPRRVASPPITFRAAAEEGVRKPLEEILKHWDGVRSGTDVEAVHDMRVATRRLRAALSVYEAAFPSAPFLKFERKIAHLTDALGDARDSDVFLEFLEKEHAAVTDARASERFGLDDYLGHLKRVRDDQQNDLLKTLRRLDPDDLRRESETLLTKLPPAAATQSEEV
jgi:CHAD domain-containing protein